MRAWLINNSVENPCLENQRDPPTPISAEELRLKTGVLYCKIDPEHEKEKFEKLKQKQGITYEDIIEISPEKLPDFDQTVKCFYTEHLHGEEESRYTLDGAGYFDVRLPNEEWVRIRVERGDLIILPGGIYHRFSLDLNQYIKVMRLFLSKYTWKPYYRPSDNMEIRKKYVQQQKIGFDKLPNLVTTQE